MWSTKQKMSDFDPICYQSTKYHNSHSEARDKFLIENFGEEWLADMKAQGHFGGDWCPAMIGKPKDGLSSPVVGKEVWVENNGKQ